MSIENTLKERSRYGPFSSHAVISQALKAVMHLHDWDALTADKKEALEMIQHKIARIINGDPDYVDNWHDIQGYAKLIEDDLVSAKLADDAFKKEKKEAFDNEVPF